MNKRETLDAQFTKELLKQLALAEEATGVSETKLAAEAQAMGGPAAVKQMLGRGRTTRQFDPLQRAGKLNLSVEALVTKGKYASLFTDEEENICLSALLAGGLYG